MSECLGTLIKTFKASFLPFFDELSVYITPMLVSQVNPVLFVYLYELCSAFFFSHCMLIFGLNTGILMFFLIGNIDLIFHAYSCCAVLMSHCFLGLRFYYNSFGYPIVDVQGKDKTPEERRIAICIFDDVAEQCRESALRYYDTYLPFLLEAANDENSDVRQVSFLLYVFPLIHSPFYSVSLDTDIVAEPLRLGCCLWCGCMC